jgi:hypothetical protein
MNDRDKIPRDENLTQHIIDPNTGRDITGEYVNQRLKVLENIAEKIVQNALKEYGQDRSKKLNIYHKAYWEIHNKLGMGSIGPATAAAGPLMEKKMQKLAKELEIQSQDLL